MNSIGFISELEAFLFGGPASLETKFDRFYKRIGPFRVWVNSLNTIGFTSEFNDFVGAIERTDIANSLCFISEFDEIPLCRSISGIR